ncbi:hypothetical protein L915_00707 [Phytophthora nicotianae]|uniref:Uncharacterized protein n=1 Tax=Phytophthora nicotianae TaxID=4792 RepID=W2HQC7_PHYNI|nr:hypothetical protein L915_00707 [Phytophthora nicotianae]
MSQTPWASHANKHLCDAHVTSAALAGEVIWLPSIVLTNRSSNASLDTLAMLLSAAKSKRVARPLGLENLKRSEKLSSVE